MADITSQSIDAELVDGFLRAVVRHEFAVRSFGVREAVYRFALPDGAALTALALETGGRRLEGVLAERGFVERSYDSLLHPALDPEVPSFNSDGQLRLGVYPVSPELPTVVELAYVLRVALEDGRYDVELPIIHRGQQRGAVSLALRVRSSTPIDSVTCRGVEGEVELVDQHQVRVRWVGTPNGAPRSMTVAIRVSAAPPAAAVARAASDAHLALARMQELRDAWLLRGTADQERSAVEPALISDDELVAELVDVSLRGGVRFEGTAFLAVSPEDRAQCTDAELRAGHGSSSGGELGRFVWRGRRATPEQITPSEFMFGGRFYFRLGAALPNPGWSGQSLEQSTLGGLEWLHQPIVECPELLDALETRAVAIGALALTLRGARPKRLTHRSTESALLRELVARQDPASSAFLRRDGTYDGFDHALATLALAEHAWEHQSAVARDAYLRGLAHLVRSIEADGRGLDALTISAAMSVQHIAQASGAWPADLDPDALPRAVTARIAAGDGAPALLAAAVLSETRSGRSLASFDLATLTEQLEQRLEFAEIATLDAEARFERFLCGSALLSAGGDPWRRWKQAQRRPIMATERYVASFQSTWDPGSEGSPCEVHWATTAATILWGFVLLADPLPRR